MSDKAPTAIRLRTVDTEHRITLHVQGEVDLATAGQLDTELRRLMQHDERPVTVDLRRLGFMDARGLAVLEAADVRARALGQEQGISVLIAEGQIKRIFELTGLTERLVVEEAPC
jgi:anti-anti-sigma factor